MAKTLSQNIVDYLRKEGKNQSRIGGVLGLGRSFISLVAHGRRQLTFEHLETLADEMDMTVPELLARATPPNAVPPRLRKSYQLFLKGLAVTCKYRTRTKGKSRSKIAG